jgi:hypothetical protein
MTQSASWALRSSAAVIALTLVAGCYGADGKKGEGEAEPPAGADMPRGGAGAPRDGVGTAGRQSGEVEESAPSSGGAPSKASGGAGGEATSVETVPLEALPALLAEADCAAHLRCWHMHYAVFGQPDCIGDTRGLYEDWLSSWRRMIEEGTVLYDGTAVEACVAEKSLASCDELLDRDSPACGAVLKGTIELGGACSSSAECKGSAACVFDEGKWSGTCRALKGRGGLCAEDSECASGLVCVDESYCEYPSALGEPCEAGAPPCKPGLWCAGATNARPGTCRSYESVFPRPLDRECFPSSEIFC